MENKKNAYIAILLFGVVSLFGDMVYEGARGVIPAYMMLLGATGVVVGFVGGFGDFLGHAIRLMSGRLADTTKSYWFFTIVGYGMIISIPLLALSNSWHMAALLIITERLGKALRSPSRDTLLSIIGKDVGSGRAFGIHEALDQTGAIAGPLMLAMILLYTNSNYEITFSFLFIPYVMMLIALFFIYRKFSDVGTYEKKKGKNESLGGNFYLYSLAVFLNTLGLVSALLINYRASQILPQGEVWIIPLIYTLIMGVDALSALPSGYIYDKIGTKFLFIPFIISIVPSVLAVSAGSLMIILLAAIFSGFILGMQESVYRAAVADMAPIESRGFAYGIFNASYGFALLASGLVFGYFIDATVSMQTVLIYSVLLQVIAMLVLWKSLKQKAF